MERKVLACCVVVGRANSFIEFAGHKGVVGLITNNTNLLTETVFPIQPPAHEC